MKRVKTSIFYAAVFVICFCSCNNSVDDNDTIGTPQKENLKNAITSFGFDLFKKVSDADENILFSPVSIHTALSMTMDGTDNNTLQQMKNVLALEGMNVADIDASYKEYINGLSSDKNLTAANAIFSDPTRINVFEDFFKSVNGNFKAEKQELNFSDPNSVNTINKWAEDNTNGKIKKVLEFIEDYEVMFIINAIHFKADWSIGFLPDLTSKKDFYGLDGKVSQVDMMKADESRSYFQNEDYAAVDLPFSDSKYSMTFIMPLETTVNDFISKFNTEDLVLWHSDLISNKLAPGRLQLNLPKFSIGTKQKLNDVLIDLGMSDAFNESEADLTKMGSSPFGKLFVSRVLHDAFIHVDEKGVEGAAVTTVGIGVTSLPPTITFNKPFFFVLRENNSNMPVFIGVLNKV